MRGRVARAAARALPPVCIGAATMLMLSAPTRADVASDKAAAIIVFPKVVVDTSRPPKTSRGRVDMLIRVSNTSDRSIRMHCFYVNANGHCSNSPLTVCDPNTLATSLCGDGGVCRPDWVEIDFAVNLTPRQPVAWLASQGSVACEDSADPDVPCFPLGGNVEGPN